MADFCLTFTIQGIVILLVNINIGDDNQKVLKENHIPILLGTFAKFSVNWYSLIGTTITFTQVQYIFVQNGVYAVFALIPAFKRWYDRGFTTKVERTRQTT